MMTNDDDMARLRRAFSAPGPAPDPAACPPAERIWLAVRGELPPGEMRQMVEHMAVCPACAEDWRLAMAFEEEEAHPVPERIPPQSVVTRLRPWLTAVAATLILTVAGIQIRNQTTKPPEYRGNGQTVESALPADAALPRERFVLDWKPVSKAATYNLVVSTSDLTTIASPQGLTATEHQVPAGDLAGFRSGTEILWTVTAIGPDGGILGQRQFRTKIR